MDLTTEHMRDRIEGLELVLLQIRRMYTNPEMRKVIDYALAGNWDQALYARGGKEVDREQGDS